jgi:hypothetical protein
VLIQSADDHPKGINAAEWILVGDPAGFEAKAQVEAKGAVLLAGSKNGSKNRMWTDDFSNLFEALK